VRVRAFIGFGSNLGDGPRLIQSAWNRLAALEKLIPVQLSSLYVTQAVGMVSQFPFTNAVGVVETGCTPTELLHLLLAMEKEHGRRREVGAAGYQDRSLDLDLLYFGGTVYSTPELSLPHPHLGGRLFVLAPLAEVAPDFVDPLTGLTAQEMARRLVSRIERGDVPPQPVFRLEPGADGARPLEIRGDRPSNA
jgi:2-amino-4-hydroxy-6-hydroxymethyldihydropteridine diphosphokinase